MKTTTLIAIYLASTGLAAQADGVVFKTPVTDTQSVTGVGAVSYLGLSDARGASYNLAPILLERVVVTPSHIYAEHEWQAHLNARRSAPQYWPQTAFASLTCMAETAYAHCWH